MTTNLLNENGRTSAPIIKQLHIAQHISTEVASSTSYNILFVKEGAVNFYILKEEAICVNAGEIALLPIGMICTYDIAQGSKIVIINLSDLNDWNQFCLVDKNISERRIFNKQSEAIQKQPAVMLLHENILPFFDELFKYLECGLNVERLMELKCKELLVLMQYYYSQNQLNYFFKDLMGKEISFVEYVQENWDKYATVHEFAASMKLSDRQFSARLMQMFGKTPYQWILENKSRVLYHELARTNKPFKQISIENNFKTLPHFNTFCKVHLGKTPSELRGVVRKTN